MCWVGKCDVKIAKRDFYVYKLGCISDEGFHSLYQNFIYVPGVINKKVKMIPVMTNYNIYKYNHTFRLFIPLRYYIYNIYIGL